MNYAVHYRRLISRALDRVLSGYCERHHVIPRCMGGTDEPANLVDLTPEEHYVAHQLLVKIYPKARGLAVAAVRMSKQCTGRKAYGWLRRRHAAIVAERMRGNSYTLGKTSWNKGKSPSAETRAKISAALRGIPMSADRIQKGAATRRGKPIPSLRGKKLSAQHRAKMSAAHLRRYAALREARRG